MKLHKNADNVLTSLTYEKDGQEFTMEGDYFISSMPVKDLVGGMNDVPAEPARIAKGLPYRDYMTLGVLVPKINLVNKTNICLLYTSMPVDGTMVITGRYMGRTDSTGLLQKKPVWKT